MIQFNGQTLAYIGDAIYELRVREHFLSKGHTLVNDLHQKVIKLTSANGQIIALEKIQDMLSLEEQQIIKRGRNAESSRKPKHTRMQDYKYATGFEALIGYLYLSNQIERLNVVLNLVLDCE